MRGYLRDVETAVADAGADPTAAYVFQIEPDGETWVETRSLGSEARSVRVPMFPVTTPLRRIDVSTVSSARAPNRAAPIRPTLPEPL